jgi:hypothetical protein
MVDLVSALERGIDSANGLRNAVHRIKALVRVHLSGGVGVRRHLPPAEIDSLQPRSHHLYRLVAGHRAQGRDKVLFVQKLPQAACAQGSECVLDLHGPPELEDVRLRVGAMDAVKPGLLGRG